MAVGKLDLFVHALPQSSHDLAYQGRSRPNVVVARALLSQKNLGSYALVVLLKHASSLFHLIMYDIHIPGMDSLRNAPRSIVFLTLCSRVCLAYDYDNVY